MGWIQTKNSPASTKTSISLLTSSIPKVGCDVSDRTVGSWSKQTARTLAGNEKHPINTVERRLQRQLGSQTMDDWTSLIRENQMAKGDTSYLINLVWILSESEADEGCLRRGTGCSWAQDSNEHDAWMRANHIISSDRGFRCNCMKG